MSLGAWLGGWISFIDYGRGEGYFASAAWLRNPTLLLYNASLSGRVAFAGGTIARRLLRTARTFYAIQTAETSMNVSDACFVTLYS